MSTKVSFRSWLRFLRIENVLMIMVLMLIIRHGVLAPLYEALSVPMRISEPDFILLILDLSLVAITGYWVNDRADQEIDAINRPERMLASGQLSVASFRVLYGGGIALGAVITGWLASQYQEWEWAWLYPVSVLAFWGYAKTLKRQGLVGNLLVSFFISAIIFIVLLAEPAMFQGLYIIEVVDVFGLLLFFALFAFLANLAREWVKDCEDLNGDEQHGVKSLPVVLGVSKTLLSVRLVLLLLIALEGLMLLRFSNSIDSWTSMVGFPMVGMAVLLVFRQTLGEASSDRLRLTSRLLKVVMLLGLLQIPVLALDIIQG